MMIRRELKEILAYLAELTAPVKPKFNAANGEPTPNDIDLAMEDIRKQTVLIRKWIEGSDRESLLLTLIEIAQMESFEEPYRNLKSQENWAFHLVDLIYQTCVPDFDKLEDVKDELSKNNISNDIASELTRWINDDE